MSLITDNWKKYPLLLVGEPSAYLPEASYFPSIDAIGNLSINDFYIIISASENELPSLLAQLAGAQLSPTQVIILLRAGISFSHASQSFFAIIDLIEGENAEDFRSRLLGKLEAQRQKILCMALQEVFDAGITRLLQENALATAIDSCRISHALACAYNLPPSMHKNILHSCFKEASSAAKLWPNDIGMEKMIIETSRLMLDCLQRSGCFRDALKEKSTSLPFRTRSDLLHHVETCLGPLVGGKSHVA